MKILHQGTTSRTSAPLWGATLLLCAAVAIPVSAQQSGRQLRTSAALVLGQSDDLTSSVQLGDVDGDGDLDAIVGNGRHWAQQNYVFYNNGRGFFGFARPLGQILDTTYAVPLVDVDGDGDLDVLVGNDSVPNRVVLNDGHGIFQDSSDFGHPDASTRSLTVADVNLDGYPDVLVTNRGDENSIFLGDGSGKFPDRWKFGETTDSTLAVAVADLDGDGDMDLIAANRDGQANHTYLGDGKGTFVRGQTLGHR